MAMPKILDKNTIWQEKLALAAQASEFLVAHVATIQGIALTGSVAYGDVDEDDDLDFFIITKTHRVYTTRLLTYLYALALGRKRTATSEKNKWCLNLFLDESDLRVPKSRQSEFARLQVIRMRVLFERDNCFAHFRSVNADWLGLMPNSFRSSVCAKPAPLLSLGDLFEDVSRYCQLAYMRPKITREYLSATQIFFHPLDRTKKTT